MSAKERARIIAEATAALDQHAQVATIAEVENLRSALHEYAGMLQDDYDGDRDVWDDAAYELSDVEIDADTTREQDKLIAMVRQEVGTGKSDEQVLGNILYAELLPILERMRDRLSRRWQEALDQTGGQ